MRSTALALTNLALAVGLIAIGLPGALAAFHRLPEQVTIGAIEAGEPASPDAFKAATAALEAASRSSVAAHRDLGYLLLDDPSGDARAQGARAVAELRTYLAGVPGDAQAWVGLARAELVAGDPAASRQALDMSILIAPSVVWLALPRCALAIDLGGALDAAGRRHVQPQFLIAAKEHPEAFARLIHQRNAVYLARAMLIDSPHELAKFEAIWARF